MKISTVLVLALSSIFITGCALRRDSTPSQSPSTSVTPTSSASEVGSVPNDWERVEDAIAGYSMAHPQAWFVDGASRFNGESQITSFDPQDTANRGGVPSSELKVAVVRFLPNAEITPSPPPSEQVISETQITVGGQPAVRRVIENLGRSISVTFEDNEAQYVITAIPADSEYIEIFDQMLSTFQLIPAVTLTEPSAQQQVTIPLRISGSAPGTWFFEAQLTARLETDAGTEVATTSLQAEGEWMTETAVPFSGTIEFRQPSDVQNLELVISKANPSGLPENDHEVRMILQL